MFGLKKKSPRLSNKTMRAYKYEGPRPETSDRTNALENWFWQNTGQCVHKWHHYLPIYSRYFEPFRNKPIRMLEIGVSWGGSLQMWRDYFGKDAIIYGIDIDPKCERYDGIAGNVRIGSQDDPEFLNSVVSEMEGIDIVLDDGSHISSHVRKSFEVLYPKLSLGGIYMIEDLHTSYWREYGGGYQDKQAFIEDIKLLIDDMHHWYHDNGVRIKVSQDSITGIHMHDSIVVFDKEKKAAPFHVQIGEKE